MLKGIVKELLEVREELKLKFSDDVLIDSAVRIYNTKLIQENKTERKISQAKEIRNTLISDDQMKLMEKLKIPYNKTMTRVEASKLIERKINK